VALVDWYVHHHRHSAIKFVTPQQRHSGQAPAICHQRIQVNEQARDRHLRRWSRSIRCWQQPAVVWINQPPDDTTAEEELPFLQAS
jgi:putative transposase